MQRIFVIFVQVHRLLGQSNDFHTAVAAGNLTMARAAFAFSQKRGGSGGLAPAAAPGSYEFGQSRMGGMNQLHADVLAADGKPITYKFKSISVTKKSGGNHALTPIHLAAINPDVQYLKALADVLGVQPMLTTTDDSNRGAGLWTAQLRGARPSQTGRRSRCARLLSLIDSRGKYTHWLVE